jgi:hypothetical protein
MIRSPLSVAEFEPFTEAKDMAARYGLHAL